MSKITASAAVAMDRATSTACNGAAFSARKRSPLIRALVACLVASIPSLARAGSTVDCHIGSYQLSDGRVIDIDDATDGLLRWRTFTGETGRLTRQPNGSWASSYGWTGRPDGKIVSFSDCAKGEIHFGKDVGRRIAFDVTDTTFESNGTKLVGRLVMPKGSNKVPVVVLVHGAEHDSARDTYELQRMFPATGIGAFVYDKRGTGASGGAYTQDFNILANDVVTAMHQARRLAGGRVGRIGYQGGSEAGWVLPLAVNREHVDYAIVSFGLAVTILEEDQESVALDMHFHHRSAEDTRKALALARAGEHVIETDGREGYEAFDALRRKYSPEPWYKDVHGDFLFFILPLNKQQIVEAAAKYLPGTPFRYEPMPALRASTTPQLWVLGTDDLEAPSAETARRIKSLIADGKRFTLAVYPGAEHGMTDYELDAKGMRVSTRYASGYFAMMRDFIRDGRIGGHYGNAEITRPEAH
jgi:pimeloyl-ACP methyl ester carboxylesterase